MAIHNQADSEIEKAFDKEIDAGGMSMVFDNLQVYQYKYPISSTIREIVSNAVDATREKNIALSIIEGRAKEEDHYLRRDEAVYRDSNFDASYFDPKWLDTENNRVQIKYVQGKPDERDEIHIVDYGVGLGGSRLEGYFKLSWSSKRNSADALGKFGLGAKAPLATGVASYRMTTRHNGREYIFDIYAQKVQSVVPKMNMVTGQPNGLHVFANGANVYYQETTEKNGTTISIEVKKHHYQGYVDAVKSQLLYFEGVDFVLQANNWGSSNIDFRASIIYEDDDIILSDNTQFQDPHLVIGKAGAQVSYGYIDWAELELERRRGNIGVKVKGEEVSLSPSRESVIWDDKTRASVVAKYEKMVTIAQKMAMEKLKKADFLEWFRLCFSFGNTQYVQNSKDPVVRLVSLLNREDLNFTFPGDSDIKGSPHDMARLLWGLDIRMVLEQNNWKKGPTLARTPAYAAHIGGGTAPIYMVSGRVDRNKDGWILRDCAQFLQVKLESIEYPHEEEDIDPTLSEARQKERITHRETVRKKLALRDKVVQQLLGCVNDYSTVEVPEDYRYSGADSDEPKVETPPNNIVNGVYVAPPTAAEIRAREERIIVHAFTPGPNKYYVSAGARAFARVKYEPKIAEIADWKGKIVYGFEEDEELLHFTVNHLDRQLVRPKEVTMNTSLYNPEEFTGFAFVMISKKYAKYFKRFTHIKQFYKHTTNNTISMDNLLVRSNTARLLKPILDSLQFLGHVSSILPEDSKTYAEATNYMNKSTMKAGRWSSPYIQADDKDAFFGCKQETYNALTIYFNKVMEFQLFLDEQEDKEIIAAKSKELFGTETVESAVAIDLALYKKVKELGDKYSGICSLLNAVQYNSTNKSMILDLVKEYIALKGLKDKEIEVVEEIVEELQEATV